MQKNFRNIDISGYGIRLTRMLESDLETYCRWKNDPEVQWGLTLEGRGITYEDSVKWHHSRNPDQDFYFIIWSGDQRIGWIATTGLDYVRHHTGGTMVIAEAWARKLDYAFRATVLMYETGIALKLPIGRSCINPRNTAALRYNTMIGMELLFRDEKWLWYKINMDKFYQFRSRITRTWLRELGETPPSKNSAPQTTGILIGGTEKAHEQNLANLKESGIVARLRREKWRQRTTGLVCRVLRKIRRVLGLAQK